MFSLELDDVLLGETAEIAGNIGVGIEVIVINEELLELGDFPVCCGIGAVLQGEGACDIAAL